MRSQPSWVVNGALRKPGTEPGFSSHSATELPRGFFPIAAIPGWLMITVSQRKRVALWLRSPGLVSPHAARRPHAGAGRQRFAWYHERRSWVVAIPSSAGGPRVMTVARGMKICLPLFRKTKEDSSFFEKKKQIDFYVLELVGAGLEVLRQSTTRRGTRYFWYKFFRFYNPAACRLCVSHG